ncbi:MAG: hypothetical protein IKY02_03385 [Lachnospiraceae bacterium]|nr:hypothetical protein [Lachnospiraceae bacterium]
MNLSPTNSFFELSFEAPEDLEWFSVREEPFTTYGVYYSEEEVVYRRLPKEVADATSARVSNLSTHSAGGRIRFITDSPYLAIRVEERFVAPFSHMPIAGKYGVAAFANRTFFGTYFPSYRQITSGDPELGGNDLILYDGIKPIVNNLQEPPFLVELFLPLYSHLRSLYVGLRKGSVLQKAPGYRYEKPILFYGSSITQGACASKPGDDYVSRLCRMLDSDILNLGFSGSARGEQPIVDYIAAQDPSVFVLDYDHNAPDPDHLRKTHYPLCEAVRKAHPDTPVVLMTQPKVAGYEKKESNAERRQIILDSYHRMQEAGDRNVWFIDMYGCFGAHESGEDATVDNTHPDSLGCLRMAERVYPVLKALLEGQS